MPFGNDPAENEIVPLISAAVGCSFRRYLRLLDADPPEVARRLRKALAGVT